MMFFSIQVESKNKAVEQKSFDGENAYAALAQRKSEAFYQSHQRNAFVFIEEIGVETVCIAAFVQNNCLSGCTIEQLACEFLSFLKMEHTKLKINEISYSAARSKLSKAHSNRFIKEYDETLSMLKLKPFDTSVNSYMFSENMLDDIPGKTALLASADMLWCADSLGVEIKRIYQGRNEPVKSGHPVHYLLQNDDLDARAKMVEALLGALYRNERIKSKRYCTAVFENDRFLLEKELLYLYQSCKGGAVVIEYSCGINTESELKAPGTEKIGQICDVAKQFKYDVLTVVCLPCAADEMKKGFLKRLKTLSPVFLCEDTLVGSRAKAALRRMAKNTRTSPDKELYRCVDGLDKCLPVSQLRKEFDNWFAQRMNTKIYPQYAVLETLSDGNAQQNSNGGAYEELTSMIGLSRAKQVIGQALDYFKAQKLFASRGMPAKSLSMHMVFTGNPGTAKTTTARLLARIMRESGLLSVGDLIEVGRADLVGRFVGSTAPTVREKFEDAKGSVLFIDEAYSLVDDRRGLFGDEAISTIVQEMENRREDTVVIFAGYPEKMEDFLRTNPGLRSRIAFHIPFEDYSPFELYGILELIAKNNGMGLAMDVKSKVLPMFESALTGIDFGNGRFVRNLFEKAQLRQAGRLLSLGFQNITDCELKTLVCEDFEQALEPKTTHRAIGFGA